MHGLCAAAWLACALACEPSLAQSSGINVVAPTLPARQAVSAEPSQAGGAEAPNPTSRSASGQGAAPSGSQRSGYGGGTNSSWGEGPDGGQVAAVATRSTAAGNCRAELSPDRQSISLMGADALPRQHVALGEFRAQQVIHSPDGRWAVAFTKLRGRPQFALMSLDLARCEAARTVDLPAEADDARFEGDDAIVRIGTAERRVRLVSGRVR
jgi:hypothetical protein